MNRPAISSQLNPREEQAGVIAAIGGDWPALVVLATAAVMLALLAAPCAGQEPQADRSLSPYFLVDSDDPGVDRLPLKSTSARVWIAGVIAEVTVTQVYRNEGRRAIEAIYVFPASTRAAVHGMRMTIGARTIEAQIARREQARQQYEQARDAGQSASLLEQQRPNVFQMNVANILPGDEVGVELRYSELLVPEDGTYQFVYPTVVGPRYSNVPESGAAADQRWVANPYLHEGEPPTYAFDIEVNISAGMAIRKVACSSHRTTVSYDGPDMARVRLDPSERAGGNRDFILSYVLAGNGVSSGLLLARGGDENFFLLMVQPPERVTVDAIPAREVIFLVDVSGSMHGFPLEVAQELLRDLIRGLRPSDSFNVVLFAGGSSLLAERSLPAIPDNIRRATDLIERQRGGGGTELLPALRRAMALPRADGTSRTVVVVTDGFVAADREAFDVIRQGLGEANLFAFGIGSSVNRFLIEGMARAGMGEPFVVTRHEEAAGVAQRFRSMVASPVLTSVRVELDGFDAYDVEPPAVPDVLAGRPVIVFGKWRGAPRGRVIVRGQFPGGEYRRAHLLRDAMPDAENGALRHLWARHRIQSLTDASRLGESAELAQEITRLGLAYGLLTDFTSFVAVDTVRRGDGTVETVKQPLPLPQGVSDMAVGDKKARGLVPVAMRQLTVADAAMGAIVRVPRPGAPFESTLPAKEEDMADEEAHQGGAVRCLREAVAGWRLRGLHVGSRLVLRLERHASSWRLTGVELDGTPAPDAVELALERRLADLESCLTQAAVSQSSVALQILIGAEGKPSLKEVSFLPGES